MKTPLLSLLAGAVLAPLAAQIPTSQDPAHLIRLRYASFDPLAAEPSIPASLRAGPDGRLWILQFGAQLTDLQRGQLRSAGLSLHGFLPERALLVRGSAQTKETVQALSFVRSLSPYHPAFRLEPELLLGLASPELMPKRRYNLVLVDKRQDKAAAIAAVQRLGGTIEHEQAGSILLEASLTGAQLLQVARLDTVQWIDRWTPQEFDMDNARIQGGGNYVETQGNYTGQGVRGHVYEGVEYNHPDFNTPLTNVSSSGAAASHGHCTAGIIFGNGTSTPAARGMAPNAVGYYTNNSTSSSRWQVVQTLVNTHEVSFTTASWGNSRTRAYTSISADADDIIFDHGIAWTQSQSNAGNQDSRPQAWAKNIFSIGAVRHRNNANPADDRWSGGGSTGPAADGRIKPDLCAYYDSILCSDLTGGSGYSAQNYTTGFGGTSGATPIVAGHNAIAIQMFAAGLFSPQRVPNGTVFQNRPKFTTLKALQIANASQYPFNASSSDNRREHVGWGFPNLKTMYDNRNLHFVVDETDVLSPNSGTSFVINVAANQPELKVSMCYADPAANPSAQFTRINDLSLRVVSPSGTVYWGNVGLTEGNYSRSGGGRDQRDTVENVFVQNPAAGAWKVEVLAHLIAQDSHVETPATDADYGLVVNGGTYVSQSKITLVPGAAQSFGTACLGSAKSAGANCAILNSSGAAGSVTMRNNVGYAFEVTAATNLTVTGFDLQAVTTSGGNQTLGTALYLPNASGVPSTVAATGTISFGPSASFATTVFNQPVAISQGSKFFIFVQMSSPALRVYSANSGNDVPYFRLTNGAWGSRVTGRFDWQARVNCQGGNIAPDLSVEGIPTIGLSTALRLTQARANASALLIVGASDSTWAGTNLPLGLGALGAQGCSLYVSLDAFLPLNTNAGGQAELTVPIPNTASLIGKGGFVQVAVDDPQANNLGLVTTQAWRLKIGN